MPRILEQIVADPNNPQAQIDFFKANSYVVLPDLLTPEQVAELNAAMDRDRKVNQFMWYSTTSRDYNCNLLLTEPIFEQTIRHPRILPLVETLMGGPICFEELAVRHRRLTQEADSHDSRSSVEKMQLSTSIGRSSMEPSGEFDFSSRNGPADS